MPKPNYERFEWRNKSVDEAAIKRAADNTEVFYAPTGASIDNAEQHLAVYQTIPDTITSDDVIIRLGAWSDDYGRDPEGAYFNGVLAQHTGKRVLAVNTPGVHYSKWHKSGIEDGQTLAMTPDQMEELRETGRFNRVGEAILRAEQAAETHFNIQNPRRILVASSMAVAALAGVMRYGLDNEIPFGGVVMQDGANYTKSKSVANLGARFVAENGHMKRYLKQNSEPLRSANEPLSRWVHRTFIEDDPRRANIAGGKALAHGAFKATLGDPEGLRGVPLVMTRGGDSRITSEEGHADVVRTFTDAGVPVNDETYERHRHAYTVTTQSVVEDLAKVA